MDLRSALLSLLLGLPPAVPPEGIAPESAEDRAARLPVIAEAIDIASGGDPVAAAVIVTIWSAESRFARWVHSGDVKGDRGRASCMGSVHPSRNVRDWDKLAGLGIEATTRCALRTLSIFRSGLGMCTGSARKQEVRMALSFEYYARGTCNVPGVESMRRARSAWSLQARLWGAK
jgi:hypothetical protein